MLSSSVHFGAVMEVKFQDRSHRKLSPTSLMRERNNRSGAGVTVMDAVISELFNVPGIRNARYIEVPSKDRLYLLTDEGNQNDATEIESYLREVRGGYADGNMEALYHFEAGHKIRGWLSVRRHKKDIRNRQDPLLLSKLTSMGTSNKANPFVISQVEDLGVRPLEGRFKTTRHGTIQEQRHFGEYIAHRAASDGHPAIRVEFTAPAVLDTSWHRLRSGPVF